MLVFVFLSVVLGSSLDWFEACANNDIGQLKSIGHHNVNLMNEARQKCHDIVWNKWHSSPPELIMPTLIWLIEHGATRTENIFAKLCSKCNKRKAFKPFLLGLIERAPEQTFDFQQALCHAARTGPLSLVKAIIPHIDMIDDAVALVLPSGIILETSALEEAISSDKVSVVKLLLSQSCYNYTKRPVLGFDPIKLCVTFRSRNCLLHFVKLGYDTSYWDDLEKTERIKLKLDGLSRSIDSRRKKRQSK